MSCPAESNTIDKFEKKKYESSDMPGYRPNGVRIIKAVKLYSQGEEREKRVELEKLLGQAINENEFTNSAWGCSPVCDCNREKHCDCDGKCNHCRCVSDCRCDNDTHCKCQGVCVSVY